MCSANTGHALGFSKLQKWFPLDSVSLSQHCNRTSGFDFEAIFVAHSGVRSTARRIPISRIHDLLEPRTELLEPKFVSLLSVEN